VSNLRLGILLSGKGRGSNMQALVEATRDGRIRGEVALVVSTSPGAPALERAEALSVPHRLIPAGDFDSQEALDTALADAFSEAGAELICLAGYMRLLSPAFLSRFPDRVLNVHPGPLPGYGGKGFYGRRVHEAVLAAGANTSAAAVFIVNEEYDQGPLILQREVPVEPGDTPDTLAARVLAVEHQVYPEAVRLYAQHLDAPGR
jgi:phosphoribosylglycinamide formyltransferase 1